MVRVHTEALSLKLITFLIVSCLFPPRWLNPLFRIGYKRRIEEDDMYEVLEEDRSDNLGQGLNRYQEMFLLLFILKTTVFWIIVIINIKKKKTSSSRN